MPRGHARKTLCCQNTPSFNGRKTLATCFDVRQEKYRNYKILYCEPGMCFFVKVWSKSACTNTIKSFPQLLLLCNVMGLSRERPELGCICLDLDRARWSHFSFSFDQVLHQPCAVLSSHFSEELHWSLSSLQFTVVVKVGKPPVLRKSLARFRHSVLVQRLFTPFWDSKIFNSSIFKDCH